jgi:predicted nuclease with TOPRIM domain
MEMAKFEAKVTTQPKVEEKAEVKTEATPENTTMDAILERLNKLEKENAELREGKMNVFTE